MTVLRAVLPRHPTHPAETQRRPRLIKTITRLSAVNSLVLLAAVVTGPLQGHVLGPVGRGELAAVLVPTAFAAVIGEFGLGTFAMREVAQGRPAGVVFGTVAAPLMLIGLLTSAIAPVLARALVGSKQPVEGLLTIGFVLLPVGLLGNLLGGIAAGLERWRVYSWGRVLPPVMTAFALLVLWRFGRLTVTSAVLVAYTAGAASTLTLTLALRGGGRTAFDRVLLGHGLRFGLRMWLGSLVGSANAHIDQVLMVGLVAPKQLGLYAVAVNVAGLSTILTNAVSGAIFPRLANGDRELVAQASRLTLFSVSVISLGVGLIAPFLLPAAFGPKFGGAVVMVELLLVAATAASGCVVLNMALIGAGRPTLSGWCEALTLVIGLPLLVVVLPSLGGLGAAGISMITSCIALAFYVYCAARQFNATVRELLVLQSRDVSRLRSQMTFVTVRGRRAAAPAATSSSLS